MKNTIKKRILRFICAILILFVSGICICAIYVYYNFIFPKGDDYDNAVYTVVIYNNTDSVQGGIKIYYGGLRYSEDVSYLAASVDNIQCGEYRKVNIPTSSPELYAESPYNVWIIFEQPNEIICGGYFGKNTGEFAFLELKTMNGQTQIIQHNFDEGIYKKVYRRDRKHQNELSWF